MVVGHNDSCTLLLNRREGVGRGGWVKKVYTKHPYLYLLVLICTKKWSDPYGRSLCVRGRVIISHDNIIIFYSNSNNND